MSLSDHVFVPYAQMLEALRGQLTKAATYAENKGFDFDVLLAARLAPDMFPLASQIRFVCMQATGAWSRLTGAELPEVAEVTSLEESRQLLDANIARLKEVTPEQVRPDDSPVSIDLGNLGVLEMTLAEYVRSWSAPQFYFHLMTAYSILRHNGVDIGKADYVPHAIQFLRR